MAIIVAASIVALLRPSFSSSAEGESRPVNPFSGNADRAQEGASLFNQYCSHCHGQWAEQGERPRDLRRLRIRYGEDAITMFYTTANNGRIDKGMPIWKGVLNDEVLWRIYTFLETVQTED